MRNRRIIRTALLCVMILASCLGASAAETATDFLGRCAGKLQRASSIKASFFMTASGHTTSGTLLTKGKKFAITMPETGTWYDGANMWTYVKMNNEATLWNPTSSELAETNPLLYLSSSKDYNVKFGSSATKGVKVLVLTPKNKSTAVKNITISVNSSTLLPKSILISASSGNCVFNIKSIQLNVGVADSSFKFDKNKYKGVRVTDLR